MLDRVQPLLIVEDDPDDVSFIRRALARANIANPAVVCASGRDARAFLDRGGPGDLPVLAVIDVYLPHGETGLQFLEWLRRQAPPLGDLPAMMFTVSAREEHKLTAAALRSVLFLSKPVTQEALTEAVLALGFVITTSPGGQAQRFIARR